MVLNRRQLDHDVDDPTVTRSGRCANTVNGAACRRAAYSDGFCEVCQAGKESNARYEANRGARAAADAARGLAAMQLVKVLGVGKPAKRGIGADAKFTGGVALTAAEAEALVGRLRLRGARPRSVEPTAHEVEAWRRQASVGYDARHGSAA